MRRIQLIEIHDQPWCPAWIRDALTGFLYLSHKIAAFNQYIVPALRKLLQESGRESIVDLGSGGGGPFLGIARDLRNESEISVTLTDLSPNRDATLRIAQMNVDYLHYHPVSVDATKVPKDVVGVRTMVASFHHMNSEQALGILKDAAQAKEPLFIFEPLARNIKGTLALLPVFITPFFLMPFVRPLSVKNLVFTYVIPILPAVIIFDGWVSFLRIYMKKDLEALLAQLPDDPNYSWEISQISPIEAPLLIGCPRVAG